MVTIRDAVNIITFLNTEKILPILYGSLGVSLYLGKFKTFNDIDLLVDGKWLDHEWDRLVKIMNSQSYDLVNLKEHEFVNKNGISVAFAKESVLIRDNIVNNLSDIVSLHVDGLKIKTLTPEQFHAAYRFSEKDGYRKNKRGKNDRKVLELLDGYIRPQQ